MLANNNTLFDTKHGKIILISIIDFFNTLSIISWISLYVKFYYTAFVLLVSLGEVKEASINRSPSAYLQNPAEERARYPFNVDKQMTLLRFVDNGATCNESVGAFSWFATHGTSMSKENKLISGDNKGVAARLFEDWFASQNKSSSPNTNSTAPGIIKI